VRASSLLLLTIALGCRRESEIREDRPDTAPKAVASGAPARCEESVDACANRAWDLLQKGGDRALAIALLEDACSRKHAWSCTNVGYMAMIGQPPVAKNEKRAFELYARACELGDNDGCTKQAFASEMGIGTTSDLVAARKLYELGDAAKNLDAIAAMGRFHLDGLGGAVHDESLALKKLTATCDQGHAFGCTSLGFMYANARGGLKKDEAKAVDLYRKGCDGGAARGCANLAWMYEHGRGVPADAAKAKSLYAKACAAGETAVCSDAGP
jgi:TPR repeat protein